FLYAQGFSRYGVGIRRQKGTSVIPFPPFLSARFDQWLSHSARAFYNKHRVTVMSKQHLVAVVGAGPAGLYGTRKLTEAGHRVLLINRDIKPGGLAEYGIFLDKEKMKTGLRKQFHRILAD